MKGYIDLHCHWVAAVDDGAKTPGDSAQMLDGLRRVGFDTVIATPHMRSGLFDNTRADLERAYRRTCEALGSRSDLPAHGLSCEHHLDDVVYRRLLDGQAAPYPSGGAALIELPYDHFPLRCAERLFELCCRRLRPILAHPERYHPVHKDIHTLDPLLDGGTVLLLDVAALVGKYGRKAKRTAHRLLRAGYYYAACSDAHRPSDTEQVGAGIERLRAVAGEDEASFLLIEGPRSILDGRIKQ